MDECGLLGGKRVNSLLEENHKLAFAYGEFFNKPTDPYCRLIDHLICLTITRPELSYVVHVIS